MYNSTLRTADRLTHLKIVAVALVAGIVVMGLGIAAMPPADLAVSPQLQARAPVLKAGQPVIWWLRHIDGPLIGHLAKPLEHCSMGTACG